jgi:hypothetical protein
VSIRDLHASIGISGVDASTCGFNPGIGSGRL